MATSQTGRKSFFQRIRGKDEPINEEMSFMDHVEALRWHLMRGVIVWLAAAIGIFVFIDWIFDNVIYAPARPSFVTYSLLCNWSHKLGLGDALCMPPVNIPLQGNTVSGPFMSAINIAMVGGIIVAFPYLFWELWRFIKPALSPKEVRYARGSILWVSLCFFIGAAFGYFLLAPFTFNFLANFTLGTVGAYKYMPTLDDYIDTLNNIILGCGIAFELPVLAYVLGKIGLITAGFLKRSPDWSSQTIVALPLLLLYEISVVIVARIDKQKAREEKEWS